MTIVGRARLDRHHLDACGLIAAQGQKAVTQADLDGVGQGGTPDDFDLCIGHQTEVEQTMTNGTAPVQGEDPAAFTGIQIGQRPALECRGAAPAAPSSARAARAAPSPSSFPVPRTLRGFLTRARQGRPVGLIGGGLVGVGVRQRRGGRAPLKPAGPSSGPQAPPSTWCASRGGLLQHPERSPYAHSDVAMAGVGLSANLRDSLSKIHRRPLP